MGDLKGHATPGSFFLLYGFWWAFCALRRYLRCRQDGTHYQSTVTFPPLCECRRWPLLTTLPLESFIKIFFSVVGLLLELLAHLPTPPMGIVQHATMYSFFLLSGIVDLTDLYVFALPPGTDYMVMAMAFGVEGLLFSNHLAGRDDLDVHLHVLLVYTIAVTVVVMVLEAKYRSSVILTVCRGYLTMLHGTWFWAVGIMLYGHDEDDQKRAKVPEGEIHERMMMSTLYFSWHGAAHLIILFILFLFMNCYYNKRCGGKSYSKAIKLSHLMNGSTHSSPISQYHTLNNEDDEDEDENDLYSFEPEVHTIEKLNYT